MSAAALVRKHFGEATLYDVLGVEATASKAQIRKRYLKMALVEHPDKGGNEDKFKALTVIYEVLCSPERRAAYDRDGDIEDESAVSASEAQWTDYWRAMFKRVETEDIDSYKERYAGSSEERDDAIAAYKLKLGALSEIMTHIIAEDDEAETRVVAVIQAAIKAGDLEALGDFKPAAKPAGRSAGKRGRTKAAKKPTAKAGSSSSRKAKAAAASSASHSDDDLDPSLMAAMKAAHSKRVSHAKSEAAEAAEIAASMGLGSGMSSLELAIRGKQRGAGSFLAGLAARHGVAMDAYDEVDDDAFAAAKPSKGKRASSKSGTRGRRR
jgi:DnaJ family protein C protein 9